MPLSRGESCWDENLWPGKGFPTHDALSAAIPDPPVLLSRVDGHALLANAKAMQVAGIKVDTALIYRAVPAPTHETYLSGCGA